MAQITEDYVSLKTAKLLKEKGFDEPCYAYWHEDENRLIISQSMYAIQNITNPCFFGPAAPTLQMAMKWLREVHKKFIDVYSYSDSFDEFIHGWSFFIRPLKYVESIGWNWDDSFKAVTDKNMSDDKTYKTYEEACEAGIKHCLTELI